tara:strand:+ start:3834 stop:4307 length:474 start_codon:yes stop_codon:yes gene_type:complete
MKKLKKIGWAVLFILLIAQFFGPEKNEGDVTSLTAFIEETNPPEEIQKIMKSSCFDCHSNSTRYPWYNSITPVNYWLADHIKEGSKHLNFSKWSEYSLKKKEHKMEELYEEVEKKNMPLNSYTWTHSEANLTDTQVKLMVDWAKGVQSNYAAQLKEK